MQNKKPRPKYSAIVLDEPSKAKLELYIQNNYPELKDWTIYAHHFTISMGPLPENLKQDLGKKVNLEIVSVGENDKVLAVGASGYYSNNKWPHITLAVNTKEGGKPKMSNDLTYWAISPYHHFTVSGTVEEII